MQSNPLLQVPADAMDTVTAQASVQDQQALAAQLAQARETIVALTRDLDAVDDELEVLEPECRQHHHALDACGALERLREAGGAELFWRDLRGDSAVADAGAEHIRLVRNRVEAFNQRVNEIESRRQALMEQIRQHDDQAGCLEEDLFEAHAEEEERNHEWIIEREVSEPPRALILPWTRGGEDDRRFRKSLGTALLVCLLFVLVAPWIELPLPAPDELAPDVPERVVRLLMESRRPPPPLPAPLEEMKPKPQEQLAKQQPVPRPVVPEETPVTEPVPSVPAAKGLLAFREEFAGMEDDQVVARLGSQANINNSGGAPGLPQRAMLTTNARGSSGGINLASLSRGLGGNGGSGMAGVQVARATSAIAGVGGAGGTGESRPLSNSGAGNSRTDEEIQIVFDRYKSALYRLYNRELRKDPTLRGQMVLRLTIEPDGSVSLCELQASDMNAAELSAQVVDRVRTINFGAKDGISAITILYPIDFLPAA